MTKKRRTLAFDVFLAENISRDTVNNSEWNGLPVGILGTSPKSPLTPTGIKIDHSDREKQDHKHHPDGQSLHNYVRSFHLKTSFPSILGIIHNISNTTNNP